MGTTHRALADRILRRTEGRDGLVRTALPGLWFFRATAPFGPKRVEARMVTLALHASPSHFTRDFRNEYGVPPAAYRARFRAG